MNKLNLAEYFELFPDALQEKYDSKFEAGFSAIDERFREVRSGRRLLTVNDVLAIFEDSLPFACDWTKPDGRQLEERMAKGAPQLIRDLQGRHDLDLIRNIRDCFRELSLTSLVIDSLSHTLVADAATVQKFDAFRKKRNISDYERTDTISDAEAAGMIGLAERLRRDLIAWIRKNYSAFKV